MHWRARAGLALLTVALLGPALIAPQPAGATAAPTITVLTPNSGPPSGGTSVTIKGTNLTGATSVEFGFFSASFSVVSSSEITATSPSTFFGPGPVNVTVTTPGGTSNSLTFTYAYPPPVVSSVTPNTGGIAGGDQVTINGTNLYPDLRAITFGGNSFFNLTAASSSSLTVHTPAHAAGAVDVVVTTGGGTSTLTGGFIYLDTPVVSAVSPSTGSDAGGTSVTITGLSFTNATGVDFGGTPASFTVDSDSSITATSPAGSVGTVDITVTTPLGTSATSSADEFTYGIPPAVTDVSPDHGPGDGGTSVTITGTDLGGATGVRFGTTPATSFVVNGATEITATTPPHAAGATDVTVVAPYGSSTSAGAFTFAAPPNPPPPGPPGPSGPPTCCRTVAADGGVFTNGSAPFYGSMAGHSLADRIVGIAASATDGGYWLAGADGGVFPFGNARFAGSMSGTPLNRPVVGVASTSDGDGYWLVAGDGGVFSFGDAAFHGSLGGLRLDAPIVGIAPTAHGYYLAASDGTVYAFGDAELHGSMAGRHLAAPVVGITATAHGYLLVAADGGVFAFGEAPMYGSRAGLGAGTPVVGIRETADGYWLAAADGRTFAFTATEPGTESSTVASTAPIVAIG